MYVMAAYDARVGRDERQTAAVVAVVEHADEARLQRQADRFAPRAAAAAKCCLVRRVHQAELWQKMNPGDLAAPIHMPIPPQAGEGYDQHFARARRLPNPAGVRE